MRASSANDMDFIAARLHGRRSQMAERERLEALCRVQTVNELSNAVYPESHLQAARDFQRRLIQAWVSEGFDLLRNLNGSPAHLFEWILSRYELENLKVLLRGVLNHVPLVNLRGHLIPLPFARDFDLELLSTAKSLQSLATLLPKGKLRDYFEGNLALFRGQTKPFLLEAALDHDYLTELLARTGQLSTGEKEIIEPIIVQEVDIHNLMLVVRLKFHYSVESETLWRLHVRGTVISRAQFANLLAAPDLNTAVGRVPQDVLGAFSTKQSSAPAPTISPVNLEALAWSRFLQLANRAFRRDPIGLGAVIGYAGIRRLEMANLVTVSEGIRSRMPYEAISTRLLPRSYRNSVYV